MTGIVNCECSDGDGHGIAPNGFGLGEGGELEALLVVLAPKFDRSTKVQFTTEPPLLPNPCYRMAAVNQHKL